MGSKMSKDSLDNSVRIRGKSKENKIVYYIMEMTVEINYTQ